MTATKKKRIVIQFIVTAKEKRAIQRAAKRQGQTLTAFILAAAESHIETMSRWEPDPRVADAD